MINRRLALTGLALASSFAISAQAFAFEPHAFDVKSFEDAQAAGKSILVEVTAPWCPTCKAQKPILSELARKPKFKEVVAFKVDFDSQKDLLRRLNVRMQSTLISYKGAKEVARSTGDTNPTSIESQLDRAL